MTSSNFTTITNQEDVQLEPAHPNGGAGPHPPPINWATRPIPRSLPTTPRKPHPMIADVNLNKGSTWNDPFRPSVLLAEATQPEYPLAHPKYHFVTTPSSGSRPREKYYVVFVGKCVGIFTFWPYVKSLIRDLKDATFQGFETFELAAESYNKARSIGVVSIKRLPGDDLQYGPVSEGMQDGISL